MNIIRKSKTKDQKPNRRLFGFCVLIFGLSVTGCRNPFDRTRDASGGGPTGTFGNSSTFVVFSNELQTGGGAFEYPGSDGQSLVFNDTSNPISRRSIRYGWTGQAVAGQTVFAGFDLMHTPQLSAYATTPGRDLHLAGYMKVTFYARGSLSSNTVLKIEVADDGNTTTPDPCVTLYMGAVPPSPDPCDANGSDNLKMTPQVLTSSWQPYTITLLNSVLSMSNVKDFFKATFVFTPAVGAPAGQGGTAYFDQIQYEQ